MRHPIGFLAVQALSVIRAVMAVLFVSVAIRISAFAALLSYFAMLSTDILDGVIARRYGCDTRGGEWLDHLSDRAVAVACVLFGAYAGMSFLVSCLFLVREVVFASAPVIVPHLHDSPRDRLIGLIAGVPLRVVTAFAIVLRALEAPRADIEMLYRIALLAALLGGAVRLWSARHELASAFRVAKRAPLLTAATVRQGIVGTCTAHEIVLTSVVTKHLIDEYRLFRESFRIFHGFDPLSVVRCDAAALTYVESLPNTIAILALHGDDRPVSQWSAEFRAIIRHKMLVMLDAWRLLSPRAVAFLDADVVVLRPFLDALCDFPAPVTLSPHHWTYDHERRSAEYGFYNAGLVLARDPCFAQWWLEAFDAQPELFGDQGCLNAVRSVFRIEHFPKEWNVGYWRHGKMRGDVPPIPADAFLIHAHVFAAARAENPYEVAQKRFVDAAIDFLVQRATPADCRLLGVIASIAASSPHFNARSLHELAAVPTS